MSDFTSAFLLRNANRVNVAHRDARQKHQDGLEEVG